MAGNQEPQAMCACLNVEYNPIQLPRGMMRERWSCTACGADFTRDLKPAVLCVTNAAELKQRKVLRDPVPTILKTGLTKPLRAELRRYLEVTNE